MALRQANRLDLRRSVCIADQTPTPRRVQPDFRAALRADGGAGAVAEVNGRVVGFVLYRVSPTARSGGPGH
jgi:hypothetical protein